MASLYSTSFFAARENARVPSDELTELAYFAPCYWRGLLRLRRLHDSRFASLVNADLDTPTFSRLADELLKRYESALSLLRERFPARLIGPAFVRSHY